MKWVKIIIGSVALVVPSVITFTDLVGYVAHVEGVSMQPCLNPEYNVHHKLNSDFVLLNRWKCHGMQFQRGEIVSLMSPVNPNEMLIKRLVALEGDIIKTNRYKSCYTKIPEGYCWIEGDNPSRSNDSNSYGPVPKALLYSKATHIIWPPERWRKLDIHHDQSRFIDAEDYKIMKREMTEI